MEHWQICGLVALAVSLAVFAVWWFFFRLKFSHGLNWSRQNWPRKRRCGYSVWRYRNGAWEMVDDLSIAPHVPGPPPTWRGNFEGDYAVVVSVPRR
jgi:hypothetical protein